MVRCWVTTSSRELLGLTLLLAVLAMLVLCPCALEADSGHCACSSLCCSVVAPLPGASLVPSEHTPHSSTPSYDGQVVRPEFVSLLLRPPRV